MKRFSLPYRLNGQERFLIWISTDLDTVETNSEGKVLAFQNSKTITTYAATKGYTIEDEESNLLDLDEVMRWVGSAQIKADYVRALYAWNLFTDLARSVGKAGTAFQQLDRRFDEVYEKLFWGNNIPAVTPKGCHFDPSWSPGEIADLATILRAGLELFQASVVDVY